MSTQLTDKILEMRVLQERMDKGKELMKSLQAQYDKLRLDVIPGIMSESDMTSTKGAFGRCTLTGDMHVKVGDKVALHGWLTDNGFGDLIVPQVNAQTLKSFVKEQTIAGGGVCPLPESIVKIEPFTRAVLYKS